MQAVFAYLPVYCLPANCNIQGNIEYGIWNGCLPADTLLTGCLPALTGSKACWLIAARAADCG